MLRIPFLSISRRSTHFVARVKIMIRILLFFYFSFFHRLLPEYLDFRRLIWLRLPGAPVFCYWKGDPLFRWSRANRKRSEINYREFILKDNDTEPPTKSIQKNFTLYRRWIPAFKCWAGCQQLIQTEFLSDMMLLLTTWKARSQPTARRMETNYVLWFFRWGNVFDSSGFYSQNYLRLASFAIWRRIRNLRTICYLSTRSDI